MLQVFSEQVAGGSCDRKKYEGEGAKTALNLNLLERMHRR